MAACGVTQGFVGWWMVASGLVDKKETKEIDKTPRVSPYRLATHAGFAYALYTMTLWQAFNCLRRPAEFGVTLQNFEAIKKSRISVHRGIALLPLVLLTGFFTAGISGGNACNTFPFVGSDWFISYKHFHHDVPLWQNFTENKLVVQVVHRTLASIMILGASYHLLKGLKVGGYLAKSSRNTKIFSMLLLLTMYTQATIGITSIYQSVPLHMASLHQIGAVSFLSILLLTMHSVRRSDPRHLRNLLGKLKVDNPQEYNKVMEQFRQR